MTLLLPAPGQASAAPVFPWNEMHEDYLMRRTPSGLLLMSLENRHGCELLYSDSACEHGFEIEVYLQSRAQMRAGDVESRTVTIKGGSKTRAAWLAAYRTARLFARATPRHLTCLYRADLDHLSISVPWHLGGCYRVA